MITDPWQVAAGSRRTPERDTVETFSARLAVTRCRPSSWPDCGGGHCPEVGTTSSPDPRRTAVPELGRGGGGLAGRGSCGSWDSNQGACTLREDSGSPRGWGSWRPEDPHGGGRAGRRPGRQLQRLLGGPAGPWLRLFPVGQRGGLCGGRGPAGPRPPVFAETGRSVRRAAWRREGATAATTPRGHARSAPRSSEGREGPVVPTTGGPRLLSLRWEPRRGASGVTCGHDDPGQRSVVGVGGRQARGQLAELLRDQLRHGIGEFLQDTSTGPLTLSADAHATPAKPRPHARRPRPPCLHTHRPLAPRPRGGSDVTLDGL